MDNILCGILIHGDDAETIEQADATHSPLASVSVKPRL